MLGKRVNGIGISNLNKVLILLIIELHILVAINFLKLFIGIFFMLSGLLVVFFGEDFWRRHLKFLLNVLVLLGRRHHNGVGGYVKLKISVIFILRSHIGQSIGFFLLLVELG